mgnify:CR=1 FL=1
MQLCVDVLGVKVEKDSSLDAMMQSIRKINLKCDKYRKTVQNDA